MNREVLLRLHDERFVADYYGVSLSTVRRWRARRLAGGAGPDAGPRFVYLGSSVRYDRLDLDTWVSSLPRAGEKAA
jgi:hypothetical protein